jgi:hypothetical protein
MNLGNPNGAGVDTSPELEEIKQNQRIASGITFCSGVPILIQL